MVKDEVMDGPTRLESAWSRKWRVLATGVVAAVLVAAFISTSPKRYSASASVRVSVAQTRAGQHEAALGSDELAAQYALLADSQPVKDAAAKTLGPGVGLGTVTAQPQAGYNLIGITATGNTADIAGRRASAVATALVDYLQSVNDAQSSGATNAALTSTKQLSQQITTLTAQINRVEADPASPLAANLASLQSSLNSLITSRQNIISSTTADVTGGTPDIRTVNLPSRGTLVSRHLIEYSLIGFLVGLLVAAELSYLAATMAARRRLRSERSRRIDISAPQMSNGDIRGLEPANHSATTPIT